MIIIEFLDFIIINTIKTLHNDFKESKYCSFHVK